MKFSRKWIYWVAATPLLGLAGIGGWHLLQPRHEVMAGVQKALVSVSTNPGEPVSRVEQMTCEVSQGWPVVLVRDANDRSPWWVQGHAERKEGQKFSARVHFGNTTTEPGQKYQIMVLSAADESAAQKFETGTTLPELPSDFPHSEAIEVVRR